MFDHKAYDDELTQYAKELADSRDCYGKSNYFSEAARLHNIRQGVVAAQARAKSYVYVKPDPKPREDKVLDEFTDWLKAMAALTGFIAFPGTEAAQQYTVYLAVSEKLSQLAKKYPAE